MMQEWLRAAYVRTFKLCVSGLLLAMTVVWAFSALAADSDHQSLFTTDQLDFQAIFARALENIPEYMETAVRENQAGDFTAMGNSWIAGRPSLQLNYYDDSSLDNKGMNEMEYGIQLPLWRPGQRRDARTLGKQYENQVAAWKEDLAWIVAGRVRSILAEFAEAELTLALQTRTVEDAQRLVEVTQSLFNAGEVARLELMQAQSLLAESRADMLQAEAAIVDAELQYIALTGLNSRPASAHRESLADQDEITPQHPHLLYLRSGVNLAAATVEQSENSAKGNPTLTFGSRRERGDRFQDYLSSVGIQLSIPFGGNSFVSSQTSAARRARVNAEVDYQNTFIQLQQALHEVEHDLFVLEEEEPLRQAQADLSRQRFEMALTAFEAGETTLAQAVIAEQDARDSERTLQMLLLERERLITQFNQLVGVLP